MTLLDRLDVRIAGVDARLEAARYDPVLRPLLGWKRRGLVVVRGVVAWVTGVGK